MSLLLEIFETLENNQKAYDIKIINASGVSYTRSRSWHNTTNTYMQVKTMELQLEFTKLKLPSQIIDLFVRMDNNEITFYIKTVKENMVIIVNSDAMNFPARYNLLLEIAENVLEESIEDYSDNNITFKDDLTFNSERNGMRYD